MKNIYLYTIVKIHSNGGKEDMPRDGPFSISGVLLS